MIARYIKLMRAFPLFLFLSLPLLLHADSDPPNVILIYTDDHGWPDVGAAGIYDDLKTPHLDALAASGVRCTSGYSSATQCVPSRAGLLTGKYQNRVGVPTNISSLNTFNAEQTIAEKLNKVGYVTGQVGKWHLGPSNQIGTHGFDYFYAKDANRPGIGNFDHSGKTFPPKTIPHTSYHLDDCTTHALTFIRAAKESPFFLYLAYRAPHVPLDAPQKYLKRFPGKMPERRRQALAMISAMDDGVGAITAELEKLKLKEKTLIFFIGDNGAPLKIHKLDSPGGGPGWDGSLNEPLNGEKGMLSEGGIRVPFLVNWPGTLPSGKVYDRPVIALDASVSTLHLAGVETSDLDGRNIISHLKGDEEGDPHHSLHWLWIGQSAIRQGDWKVLRNGQRSYLFNLAKDKEEKHNLAAEHPKRLAELTAALEQWEKTLPKDPQNYGPGIIRQGERFFDHYIDGKTEPRPKPKPRATKKKTE